MSSNLTYAAPGATGVDKDHPAGLGYTLEIVDQEAAIIKAHPEPRKKIAICGFAASSRMLAPFDDPEWEIHTLNQLYRHVPRATRHYDIHRNFREDNVEGTDHPRWLAECGIPVYMTQVEPSIPTSIRYPLERVIERVVGTDYFTSTVAFMVAHAIYEIDQQVEADVAALDARANALNGPEAQADADDALALLRHPGKFRAWLSDRYAEREIGIFGIDLIVGTEYDFQKACVEYLLGLANARGITVRIPPQSALLKQLWRYGYETEPAQWPIRKKELDRRVESHMQERNKLIAQLQTIDGALQEAGYWQQAASLRERGGAIKLNEDTG